MENFPNCFALSCTYRKTLSSAAFYKKWQLKLLNREIQFKKKLVKSLSQEIDENISVIRGFMSAIDFYVLNNVLEKYLKVFESDSVMVHDRKLRKIGIDNDISPCDPNNVVFNYSSILFAIQNKDSASLWLRFLFASA